MAFWISEDEQLAAVRVAASDETEHSTTIPNANRTLTLLDMTTSCVKGTKAHAQRTGAGKDLRSIESAARPLPGENLTKEKDAAVAIHAHIIPHGPRSMTDSESEFRS
jgi:hypothetical protein